MNKEEIIQYIEQERKKYIALEEAEFSNEGLINAYIGRINMCSDILDFINGKNIGTIK